MLRVSASLCFPPALLCYSSSAPTALGMRMGPTSAQGSNLMENTPPRCLALRFGIRYDTELPIPIPLPVTVTVTVTVTVIPLPVTVTVTVPCVRVVIVVVDWTNDIVTLFLGQLWSQPCTGVSKDTPVLKQRTALAWSGATGRWTPRRVHCKLSGLGSRRWSCPCW